jgi:phosphoglycolate phosphatase
MTAAGNGVVLFDLDGVLADSRAAITGSINAALVASGRPARPAAELYHCIGPPLPYAFAELIGAEPESDAVAALVAGYRARYATASLTETVVTPGIGAALEALRHAGRRLGVATSKPRPFAEPLLEALGLRARFEVVAGPGLDADGETKAQTVRQALDALATSDAVMVGDRRFDVEGAHANGLRCIGVTWGFGSRAELEAAGADAIVEHPRELPVLLAP